MHHRSSATHRRYHIRSKLKQSSLSPFVANASYRLSFYPPLFPFVSEGVVMFSSMPPPPPRLLPIFFSFVLLFHTAQDGSLPSSPDVLILLMRASARGVSPVLLLLLLLLGLLPANWVGGGGCNSSLPGVDFPPRFQRGGPPNAIFERVLRRYLAGLGGVCCVQEVLIYSFSISSVCRLA